MGTNRFMNEKLEEFVQVMHTFFKFRTEPSARRFRIHLNSMSMHTANLLELSWLHSGTTQFKSEMHAISTNPTFGPS